jgi:superoxide reductase
MVTEKQTGRETVKGAKEPVKNTLNPAESKKEHVLDIEAPRRVIAGKPFEVIVTVTGVPDVTDEKNHTEQIELYLHNKSMGRKEMNPQTYEETESIFKIEADEALIALKEINTCRIHGVNICGEHGEKSVVTNLRARVSCNIHGISEAVREIEVLSGEFVEPEEVNNVYVKPGDQREFIDKGP